MNKTTVVTVVVVILVAVSGTIFGVRGVLNWQARIAEKEAARANARALVDEWADRLDGNTNDSGTYIRYNDTAKSDIAEATDSWGNCLVVQYSRGGFTQILKVRSKGPDGNSHTPDDLWTERQSTNLSGIGSGIKDNIEETAERAGRGGASGIIQGIAEGKEKVKAKIKEKIIDNVKKKVKEKIKGDG